MRPRALIAAALALAPAAAAPAAVRVRQAGLEWPVEPLVEQRRVDLFYGYDSVQASSAFTGLEAPETSLLLLHQEPDGPLSLVVLHDIYSDPTGGSAVFRLAGLPEGTVYSVQDDPYDLYDPDPPVLGQTTATNDWSPCCTDGFALTGLQAGPFCVSVAPSFGSGVLTWQLLSGPLPTAVTRTDLPSLADTVYLCQDCQALSCPAEVTGSSCGGSGAVVRVTASGSSLCGGDAIANDRTAGGADATGTYPQGTTLVTFTLVDAAGFVSTCQTRVVVSDAPDPVPPDQGNVLRAVETGPDVALSWTGVGASIWRLHRDPAKDRLGSTPLLPDAAVERFVDPGRVAPVPGVPVDFYRVKGLSPCSLTPGP